MKLFNVLNRHYVHIIIIAYLVSVFLIAPWGDYALADDFYYLTQVKAFSIGEYTRSALIGPTFVLQGFMGLVWSWFFGLSYLSLRTLSIIVSVLCIYTFSLVLDLLSDRNNLKILSTFTLAFNPYFYSFSLNFMTENYFLLFSLLSLYYFLCFLKNEKHKNLLVSSILGGLSIMIRQFGVVSFFTYIIVTMIKYRNNYVVKKLLIIIIPFLIIGGLGILWPKYVSQVEVKSTSILLFFSSYSNILNKLTSLRLPPYIGFVFLPFSFTLITLFNKYIRILIAAVSMYLSYMIYKLDIFSIGNLLYTEGYQARLRVNIRENLFNNAPFKLFLSYFIALSILTLVCVLAKKVIMYFKKIPSPNFSDLTIVINIIGYFLIAIIAEAYFDRYYFNFFVLLIILASIVIHKSKLKISPLSYVFLVLLCVFTIFIVVDYHNENKIKWSLARKLSSEYDVRRYDIFIDNIYTSTVQMEETENYQGFKEARPGNYNPYCFVQEFVRQKPNVINDFISYINNRNIVRVYFENPVIIESGNFKEYSNHFDSNDTLYYEKEYLSPVYNILGKRMFVRAFCTDDIIQERKPEGIRK